MSPTFSLHIITACIKNVKTLFCESIEKFKAPTICRTPLHYDCRSFFWQCQVSNPTLCYWDDSRHLKLNTTTPIYPVKTQLRPAARHHPVHALTRFNKQTPSIGQKAPTCLNKMAKHGAARQNTAWPSLFDMCRAVSHLCTQQSSFLMLASCALSAFHLLLTIGILFLYLLILCGIFFFVFLKEILKVYSMLFWVCDWCLLFNKQSVNWSVLWGAVGLLGQLH